MICWESNLITDTSLFLNISKIIIIILKRWGKTIMPTFKQLNKKRHSTHVISQITKHNLNQQYIVWFTPSIHSTTQSIWLRLVVYMFSYVCVCVLCMHFTKHWGEMGIRLTPICRKTHGGSKHSLSLSKYRQKLRDMEVEREIGRRETER